MLGFGLPGQFASMAGAGGGGGTSTTITGIVAVDGSINASGSIIDAGGNTSNHSH